MRTRITKEKIIEFRKNIAHLRDVEHLSFNEIGEKYNKNHSTIITHYQKYKKEMKETVVIFKANPRPKPPKVSTIHKYEHLLYEPINQGKNYDDYLKEQGIKKPTYCVD